MRSALIVQHFGTICVLQMDELVISLYSPYEPYFLFSLFFLKQGWATWAYCKPGKNSIDTVCLFDPCLCLCFVRGGSSLSCILREAGSPLWLEARSHSHTARLFVVEGCTSCWPVGQGATCLRSQCPAGKHASEPFLSIGQMAALCFVCLIFQRLPVCAIYLM